MNIRKTIIEWYYENKRELPWRENIDPYKVWLSEIILQQTRISQGTSYFLKILKACPDVHGMASCTEEDILLMWQGLGYYSRARNMHATAKHVSNDLNGVFPESYKELLKLKGVGKYTAAAIASICYNDAVPSIDGNVYRFISRLYSISDPIDTAPGQRVFQEILEKEISKSKPGDFNQALMEYGATVCTPKKPLCEICVFLPSCTSRQNNAELSFPIKRSKTKVKDIYFYYFVFTFNDRVWIRKREEKDIWRKLHDFPSLSYNDHLDPQDVINSSEFKSTVPGKYIDQISGLNTMTHILSHRRICASFIHVQLNAEIKPGFDNTFAIKRSEFSKYPIPVLIEKFWQSFIE